MCPIDAITKLAAKKVQIDYLRVLQFKSQYRSHQTNIWSFAFLSRDPRGKSVSFLVWVGLEVWDQGPSMLLLQLSAKDQSQFLEGTAVLDSWSPLPPASKLTTGASLSLMGQVSAPSSSISSLTQLEKVLPF